MIQRIGTVGGGQLAMLLGKAARKLGLDFFILSETKLSSSKFLRLGGRSIHTKKT